MMPIDDATIRKMLGQESYATYQDIMTPRVAVPEGSVVVDRARFERLLAVANAAARVSLYAITTGWSDANPTDYCVLPPEWREVIDALQPGDRDPLP